VRTSYIYNKKLKKHALINEINRIHFKEFTYNAFGQSKVPITSVGVIGLSSTIYSEGLQEDKKYGIVSRTIYKRIGKKGLNRKIESDSSSEVITHIEIQKEIDTIHVTIHIGFPNLLKKKGAIEKLENDLQKEVNSVSQKG
jgi:hypothetical protein